ncbi:N-acetylmuramoyl-L-alanine amidase [Bacillus freudenreichii]|nr:N-acetylmuramoyl-L-alanine amidase [Bacillus freudenreichii]
MKKPLKLSIYLMLAALVLQVFPLQTNAAQDEVKIDEQEFVLFTEQPGETAEVYEDKTGSKVIGEVEDDSPVLLLEDQEKDERSLIRYQVKETGNEELVGYVRSDYLVPLEEADEFRSVREAEEVADQGVAESSSVEHQQGTEEVLDDSSNEDKGIEESGSNDSHLEDAFELLPDFEEDISKKDLTIESQSAASEFEKVEEETLSEGPVESEEVKVSSLHRSSLSTFSVAKEPEEILSGVALKSRTNVYDVNDRSKVLKSYKQGHILKFRSNTESPEFYNAAVIINGKRHEGVINKGDVDLLVDAKSIQGYAVVEPLRVYNGPDKNSSTLKSYRLGSSLKYQTFSTNWHKATVYVNGKRLTGYIHTGDVRIGVKPSIKPAIKVKGIAKLSPTAVYSDQSTTSKKLKTYPQGQILTYTLYNDSWHKATVYVNGKAETGYIHVGHVENIQSTRSSFKGIALKSPTRIYSRASTSSATIKSYSQGHLLSYRTFTRDWYEATVYVNGKPKTGYINRSHVENIVGQQKSIRGAAIKNPTKVYAKASTGSKALKSYRLGHGLIYRTLTSNWYEATVYVNGKKRTGYIHKNDVASLTGKTVVLDPGHGGHDPGAQALGLVEKELNLDIALRAEKLLKNAGASVIMTRSDDVFVSLAGRAGIANTSGADIFVSIHGNSFNGSANGVETFWYGKYEELNSIRLANTLQNRLVTALNLNYRRVAEGNFHVIRETQIPSALVEVGFLDYPGDAEKLRLSTYRQRAAEGILLGIIDYF